MLLSIGCCVVSCPDGHPPPPRSLLVSLFQTFFSFASQDARLGQFLSLASSLSTSRFSCVARAPSILLFLSPSLLLSFFHLFPSKPVNGYPSPTSDDRLLNRSLSSTPLISTLLCPCFALLYLFFLSFFASRSLQGATTNHSPFPSTLNRHKSHTLAAPYPSSFSLSGCVLRLTVWAATCTQTGTDKYRFGVLAVCFVL